MSCARRYSAIHSRCVLFPAPSTPSNVRNFPLAAMSPAQYVFGDVAIVLPQILCEFAGPVATCNKVVEIVRLGIERSLQGCSTDGRNRRGRQPWACVSVPWCVA